MAIGYSLNIGLNAVNASKYAGKKYNILNNAENDAEFYYQMALKKNFIAEKLIGKDATSDNLANSLASLAKKMLAGDILFLSYSGHGTRVRDLNGDEQDGYDEAMVLYDRLFIDDELKLYWDKFQAGVRIFFISDSCFNGTVTKAPISFRGIDPKDAEIDFKNNLSYYKSLEIPSSTAACSIIHIAACTDIQRAVDGPPRQNGLFTSIVRDIYDDGNFTGSYQSFFNMLSKDAPSYQTPYWDTEAGKDDEAFANSPFLQI